MSWGQATMTESRTTQGIGSWRALEETALPALAVLFGLQVLRMLLNGLVFYLRDAQGFAATTVGLYAFLFFLVAFLAAWVHRLLGPSRALASTAAGLALVRLIEQFVTSPLGDLVLATIGTGLFLLFIPIYAGRVRGQGTDAGGLLALGLLLGIAADTAIKGASATLDLSWQRGAVADGATIILVALYWGLLWRVSRRSPTEPGGGEVRAALPLLVVGPLLFLGLLWFQNIGQQTVLLEWSQPWVFLWIALANAAGITAGVGTLAWAHRLHWMGFIAMGALLVLSVAGERSGLLAAFVALVGQVALAVLVMVSGMALGAGASRPGLRGTTVAGGLSMMLLMLLMFSYYATYDLAVPLGREAVAPLAAALLALVGVGAARTLPRTMPRAQLHWTPAVIAVLLLLLPLSYLLAWDDPQPVAGSGFPVRVMSYNLHQGFDTTGFLDMEKLARTIEEEQPDIVALQEVSRAWVIDGAFDMLPWLSRRLEMPYVWGPAADSVWGNAILSRFPLSDAETHPMPNNADLLLKRSFTSVVVDIGNGETLRVIATHLHHPRGEGVKRAPQLQAILDVWGQKERTVIMGDLNARPEDPELGPLREAGLLDAFLAAGETGKGYTSPSKEPFQRIDYIWISPDLRVSGFAIGENQASDHFPIAVTVER